MTSRHLAGTPARRPRPAQWLITACLLLALAADRGWPAEPVGEAKPLSPAGVKTVVFFGGVKTHGPGAHEHLKGAQLLRQCLETAPNRPPLKTRIYLDAWPTDSRELDDAATIVLLWEGWDRHLVRAADPDKAQKLDQLMKRGTGLVCLHAATAVEDRVEALFLDWIGGNKKVNFSLHPMARDVRLSLPTPAHPVCRGVKPMRFESEEFYCKIFFRPGERRIAPILEAMLPPESPQKQVVGWACQRADGGRAFGCTGPHFHAHYGNPDLRRLILNAILWTAGLEVPPGGVQSRLPAEE